MQARGQHQHAAKHPSLSSNVSLSSMAKKVRLVNYPTIASNLCYFLSACSFFFALSQFHLNDINNFANIKFRVGVTVFVPCLFLAKLCIYAQFLARLYSCFKGSYLESSKCTIVTAITLLCVLLLCIIWWIILINLQYSRLDFHSKSYNMQLYILFVALLVFECCLSWFVVALFVHKLFHSVLLRSRATFFNEAEQALNPYADEFYRDIELPSRSPTMNSKKIEYTKSLAQDIAFNSIDRRDDKRLNLITKQLILSSTSIATSQLAYILLITLLALKQRGHFHDDVETDIYVLFAGVLYPMEVVLNCLALWFSYSFASTHYDRCCKCCHNRCKICVLRRTAVKIQNKYINMNKDAHAL